MADDRKHPGAAIVLGLDTEAKALKRLRDNPEVAKETKIHPKTRGGYAERKKN